VSGTTTLFVDDGDTEVGEYDGTSGNLLRRYVPGPAVDDLIAMGRLHECHRAQLYGQRRRKDVLPRRQDGLVVAMSKSDGTLSEGPYTYDPYGNCISGGSSCGTGEPYRFTGQRLDPETGLYYYRARYYSPALGRFLQTDSIGYKDDIDWYTYVGNDPTDKTDPTGNDACNGGHTWCPDGTNKRAEERVKADAKAAGQFVADHPGESAQIAGAAISLIPMPQAKVAGAAVSEAGTIVRAVDGENTVVVSGGRTPGPTVDRATGREVGRIVGDSKGNNMIEPVGGSTKPGPNPGDTHTTYPNGSNYQRLNPNGHPNNPVGHGHGHLEGTGPFTKGQGPSIDPQGNVVPSNSPDAHWPIN